MTDPIRPQRGVLWRETMREPPRGRAPQTAAVLSAVVLGLVLAPAVAEAGASAPRGPALQLAQAEQPETEPAEQRWAEEAEDEEAQDDEEALEPEDVEADELEAPGALPGDDLQEGAEATEALRRGMREIERHLQAAEDFMFQGDSVQAAEHLEQAEDMLARIEEELGERMPQGYTPLLSAEARVASLRDQIVTTGGDQLPR